MIDRIAELYRNISRMSALKVVEFAFAPIVTGSTLFGCAVPQTSQPERASFPAQDFKYRISIETWRDDMIFLFTNDEPSLDNSGASTILRASNVYCPHGRKDDMYNVNNTQDLRSREAVYIQAGCPEFAPQYIVSTPKEVKIIAQH